MLSYALAFVAIERITANRSLSWSAALTLAALIGFLGLTEETVALTVLGLLAALTSGTPSGNN